MDFGSLVWKFWHVGNVGQVEGRHLVCVCVRALTDTMRNDCKSNRSLCGETEEVHCKTNGNDSFCSCKSGYENNGFGNCQGASLLYTQALRCTEIYIYTHTHSQDRVTVQLSSPQCSLFSDKNECRQFGVCSQICNNTKGSYKCSCHKYFTKINDSCKADSKYFTSQLSLICVLFVLFKSYSRKHLATRMSSEYIATI